LREARRTRPVRTVEQAEALAFGGIHIISPEMLKLITEEGIFSIIDTYLRLSGSGEKINAFRAEEYYWRDLGKPTDLRQAASDISQGLLSA
jgi:mannose-1-phosphate guanylyltransferase